MFRPLITVDLRISVCDVRMTDNAKYYRVQGMVEIYHGQTVKVDTVRYGNDNTRGAQPCLTSHALSYVSFCTTNPSQSGIASLHDLSYTTKPFT
jgi:hypothetical protein